jgi:hypothetical protein
MRFWPVFCLWVANVAFAQNSATQFLNLTATFSATHVTLTAYQQTSYSTLDDTQAYILIPTVSNTKTIADVQTLGKIDLDFVISVVPVQTAADTFQLQAASLVQRFNLVGFLSPFYYNAQFYPPAVQGLANPLYCYTFLSHAGNKLKLWYQGQTTIGGQDQATQTVAMLLSKDYTNYNILQSATPSTAIANFPVKLTLSAAAVSYLQNQAPGTYFFQIYLTLNPYQDVSNDTLKSFLVATENFLNVLYGQTFSYADLATAQVLANRAFLQNEIAQVQAEIDLL